MSSTPRRGGFRLPWSSDDELAPEPVGETAPPEAAVGEAAAAPVEAQPAEAQAADVQPAGLVRPAPAAGGPQPAEESSEFLSSLVSAMRDVADEARRTTVEQLRHDLQERINEVKERAGKQAEELHRSSESDLAAVVTWEEAEIERIRAESARRAEARRRQLEEQLADNERRSEAAAEVLRARVSEYERELERFFADLVSVSDPAAFVAAAKRMPRSPVLPAQSPAPATPQARAPAPAAPEGASEAESVAPAETAGESAEGWEAAEASQAAAPPTHAADESGGAEEPAGPADLPTAAAEADRDAALEARLAALDASLAAKGADPDAGGTGANGISDASTSVVVKGLGSFGAITTFKQSIERLAGVRSVALSLGPTGEFVYRAVHDPAYDISEALRTLEPTADVERQPDGTVRLTITRSR